MKEILDNIFKVVLAGGFGYLAWVFRQAIIVFLHAAFLWIQKPGNLRITFTFFLKIAEAWHIIKSADGPVSISIADALLKVSNLGDPHRIGTTAIASVIGEGTKNFNPERTQSVIQAINEKSTGPLKAITASKNEHGMLSVGYEGDGRELKAGWNPENGGFSFFGKVPIK